MFKTTSLLAVLMTALLGALPAGAQETLADQQARAQARFRDLHERMDDLQRLLTSTEPRDSERLAEASRFIRERRIHEDMATTRGLLAEQRWDQAIAGMKELRADLDALLAILLDRELDLDELRDEIERYEAFKERLEELIASQQEAKAKAAEAAELERHAQALERARQEVEELLARQQELRDATGQQGEVAAPEQAERMAGRQGELEEIAERLAEKLERLEAQAAELAAPPDPDAGEGEPGDGEPGAGEPSAGEPGGTAGGAPQPGGAGACQSASKAMDRSQQKLQANEPAGSLPHQDDAIESLREAADRLAELAEEARRRLLQLPFEQQVAAQEALRADTDALARDMEANGAEEGQPSGQQEPAPGTENVQQAVPRQKAAAGSLKSHAPSKAEQEQQDAKDDLEKAKQKLEDALAQLRQQLQDEVLRALEERFVAMLAAQRELTVRTADADRLAAEALTADGGLPAGVARRCVEISDGESVLAGEADDALALLAEEGTTAVFPEIIEEIRDDLQHVAARIAGHRIGATTQAIQRDIEVALGLLIDALRREIEEREGGKCAQCDGEPPLVPLSAELKLIKFMQERVAKRTQEFDTVVPEDERVTDAARDRAGEISRKQGRVEELTRKLAVKLNKEAERSGGGR